MLQRWRHPGVSDLGQYLYRSERLWDMGLGWKYLQLAGSGARLLMSLFELYQYSILRNLFFIPQACLQPPLRPKNCQGSGGQKRRTTVSNDSFWHSRYCYEEI